MRVETVARRITPAELAQMQSAGTAVDTIHVRPLRVVMRVGQEYPLFGFGIDARDASGKTVADFGPTFVIADSHVIQTAGLLLRARAPGTATLTVEALPRDPEVDPEPRRPATRVELVVEP
jgi:hypothetical protein